MKNIKIHKEQIAGGILDSPILLHGIVNTEIKEIRYFVKKFFKGGRRYTLITDHQRHMMEGCNLVVANKIPLDKFYQLQNFIYGLLVAWRLRRQDRAWMVLHKLAARKQGLELRLGNGQDRYEFLD